MKGFVLLTGAALMLAPMAFAAPDKGKKETTPKTIKCPVMSGNTVNIADATKNKMYTDYKGRRYFFCCGGCPATFKANPEKYAKSPSIPTPKPDKKKPGKKA
jgi:YHS domain-containing protein